jgi:hypothetical protein
LKDEHGSRGIQDHPKPEKKNNWKKNDGKNTGEKKIKYPFGNQIHTWEIADFTASMTD